MKSLRELAGITKTWAKKNAPNILFTLGLGTFGYSVYACAKETPGANKYAEEKKEELGVDKLPVKETAKLIYNCYPKTALSTASGATMLVASNFMHNKTHARDQLLIAAGETAFAAYRQKVADVVTEKVEHELAEPILAKKEADILAATGKKDISVIDSDMIWCQDIMTGRRFWKSKQTLQDAITKINAKLLNETRVSYNDYLYLIGEDGSPACENLEWDVIEGSVELKVYDGNPDKRTWKTPTIIDFNRRPRQFSTAY